MKVAEPLVSVTVLAFNHGKYIRQAIQSVLEQTHQDLEVVVINDGSTDNTAEVLNRIVDSRVRIFHQVNLGPSVAANRALSECRGKYVAVMAGDDLLPPNRIERQLGEYLKGESRILFAQAEFIDEEGNPSDTDQYRNNLTPAIGRAEILRRLFDGRAPAFILTLFTEASILKGLAQYCDPALYQLQDFELIIRLAKKYEFCYLNEKLYRFRLRRGSLNLSGSDPFKLIRTRNEFYLLMRHFFDDIPISLFKEMFPDLVRNPGFTTSLEYKCEQAFVWLKSPNASLRLLGAERLYDLGQEDEGRTVLAQVYGFTHKSFADTTKRLDVERQYPHHSYLSLDTGTGFDDAVRVKTVTNWDTEEFTLAFDLSGRGPVRAVRWEPGEGCYCKVQPTDISYWDATGKIIPVSLDKLISNGHLLPDGAHLFLTLGAAFLLPIEGDVAGIAIKGKWWNHLGRQGEQLRYTTLYPDDGHNCREETAVRKGVYLEAEKFSLTFNLSGGGPVRCLRWDPLEGCFCKVRLDAVAYRDASGASHTLDPAKVTSNGTLLTSGTHLFDTLDPMFFLPIEGTIRAVTVQGRWWGPLSAAEVEQQKPREQATRERSPRWVRQILKGSVQQLRRLKRLSAVE